MSGAYYVPFRDLCEVLGEVAACKLVAAIGGTRLYVPRKDRRYLRRNALVALGNLERPGARGRARLRRYAAGDDELLAEHARWSLARQEQRCG